MNANRDSSVKEYLVETQQKRHSEENPIPAMPYISCLLALLYVRVKALGFFNRLLPQTLLIFRLYILVKLSLSCHHIRIKP